MAPPPPPAATLPAPLRRAADPRRVLLTAGTAAGREVPRWPQLPPKPGADSRPADGVRVRRRPEVLPGGQRGAGGIQRDVALFSCLSSLCSSEFSAAGLTWPERSSLREGGNFGQPGTAPAPRPCQGTKGTTVRPSPAMPRAHSHHGRARTWPPSKESKPWWGARGVGVPVLPHGIRTVVPVSVHGLRVIVLLPARGQRLNGARGQPCS